MINKAPIMIRIELDKESVYIDLNDLLDVLKTSKKGYYTLIFDSGEVWYNIKLKKEIVNLFNKIKKERGQK